MRCWKIVLGSVKIKGLSNYTYYEFEIVGEGITAIPIIKECIKQRPDVNVLMTTTTVSAL